MQETIQLQPEKITELAQKINETVSSLTNIDAIIRDTESDLNHVKNEKQRATETKYFLKINNYYITLRVCFRNIECVCFFCFFQN